MSKLQLQTTYLTGIKWYLAVQIVRAWTGWNSPCHETCKKPIVFANLIFILLTFCTFEGLNILENSQNSAQLSELKYYYQDLAWEWFCQGPCTPWQTDCMDNNTRAVKQVELNGMQLFEMLTRWPALYMPKCLLWQIVRFFRFFFHLEE